MSLEYFPVVFVQSAFDNAKFIYCTLIAPLKTGKTISSTSKEHR